MFFEDVLQTGMGMGMGMNGTAQAFRAEEEVVALEVPARTVHDEGLLHHDLVLLVVLEGLRGAQHDRDVVLHAQLRVRGVYLP